MKTETDNEMDTSAEIHEHEITHLDHDLRQIEKRQFGELQKAPDSLPVLEAFQEFLDSERRRTRKRMQILSAIFALILLATIGAGVFTFRNQFSNVEKGFYALNEKARAFAEKTSENNKATKVALGNLYANLSEMKTSISSDQVSMLTSQSNIVTKVGIYEKQVNELQQMLDDIENENNDMKSELAKMNKTWLSVSKVIRRNRNKKANRTRNNLQAEITPEPLVAAATGKTPTILLTIVPPGESHGIKWRLPAISTKL